MTKCSEIASSGLVDQLFERRFQLRYGSSPAVFADDDLLTKRPRKYRRHIQTALGTSAWISRNALLEACRFRRRAIANRAAWRGFGVVLDWASSHQASPQ